MAAAVHPWFARTKLSFLLLALGSTGWSGGAHAQSPRLADAVPADATLVYFHNPQKAAKPSATWSTLNIAAIVASQAQQMGLLSRVDQTWRAWIDALATIPTVAAYPHALVLHDITGKPRADGGHELSNVQAALVVQTGGDSVGIEGRIRHLLATHTNNESSVLTSRSVEGRYTLFTLEDRRLPTWATISWGAVGDFYVATFGDRALQMTMNVLGRRAAPLSADPWFQRGRSDLQLDRASMTWVVDFARLEKRVDAALAEKIRNVAGPLGLGEVDRGIWAVARAGRAIEVSGQVLRGGRTERHVLARADLPSSWSGFTVPGGATGYAVVDLEPAAVLRGVTSAYLSARSPDARESSRDFWQEVEREAGVSIQRDVVRRLRRGFVVHNHPPCWLGLPLAWTIVVRVEEGAEADVFDKLGRLLGVARSRLEEADGGMKLRRDRDDVWYLDLGVGGPAIGTVGSWLVVSYSPEALRANLRLLAPSVAHALENGSPKKSSE